jgi:hypothetical protein
MGATPDLRDDSRELPDTPSQWIRPTVAVEVEYRQRLRNGLRHAALKGIKPDKKRTSHRISASRRSDRPSALHQPAHTSEASVLGRKVSQSRAPCRRR